MRFGRVVASSSTLVQCESLKPHHGEMQRFWVDRRPQVRNHYFESTCECKIVWVVDRQDALRIFRQAGLLLEYERVKRGRDHFVCPCSIRFVE